MKIRPHIFFVVGILIVSYLFYFTTSSKSRKFEDKSKMFVIFAADRLDDVANRLEYYQLKYDKYPDSLQQLRKLDASIELEDVYSKNGAGALNIFHYASHLDTYVLFSVGEDGIPNTKDDIFPRKCLEKKN